MKLSVCRTRRLCEIYRSQDNGGGVGGGGLLRAAFSATVKHFALFVFVHQAGD